MDEGGEWEAWLYMSSPQVCSCLTGVLVMLTIVVASYCVLFCRTGAGVSYDGDPDKKVRRPVLLQLPPGSLGWPFLGISETLQFVFCNSNPIGSPPPFLTSRLCKYGTVFKTHLMGRPTVVSMDPELNKLLLQNEEKLVQVEFPGFIKKIVGPMLTVHGVRHRAFRELALSFLSPSAVQSLHLYPVQECARAVLGKWLHMPVIDAQQESKKMVFTFLARSLLSLPPEDWTTLALMKDFVVLMHGYSAVPVNLPGTTYGKVMKARERIFTKIRGIVKAREKMAAEERPKDILSIVLKQRDEGGEHFTSEKDIVDLIFFLVLGGFETTNIVLTNVLKFLSENAHVVDELQKEHLRIREGKTVDEMLMWNDVQEMHLTRNVIKETLRIASVVHFVTREALQDIVFKDIVIPKGWPILINFSMIHLNASYFKAPLEFNPWRWEDTDKAHEALLMPFGGGLRSCLGSVLAKFEISSFLHYLLTTYKWQRIAEVDGQNDVVSSLSFPTMRKGLLIKVEPLHPPTASHLASEFISKESV